MLSPYTVIDLTDDRGELASMFLGDLGADVIKIEPPQGSSSRRVGPFLDNAPQLENSLRYFAFNRNKRGVTLDLAAEEGRRALVALAGKADFIVESARLGEMDKLGLGFDSLRQANPRIVYVAITPYGQDGPHAGLAASDLTLAAMGGQMSVQGDPGRPPVRISVPQVWLHASVEAVVGALTAHARMRATDEAQFVDVSAQAATVWTMLHGRVAHAIQGFDFNRSGSAIQSGTMNIPLVYQCADGYIVAAPMTSTLTKVVRWLVEDGIVPNEWIEGEDWLVYQRKLVQGEPIRYELNEVVDAVGRFVRTRTKSELLESGLREQVSLAPVHSFEDLARFRQLEARGYWLTAPLPNGSTVEAPGLPAQLTETPMKVRRWPPALGQHNREVLESLSSPLSSPSKQESLAADGRAKPRNVTPAPLPFEGVKVADFTWVWVGPTTTKYLADHGATVVRVESQNRPDTVRFLGPYKDQAIGPNRTHAFNDFNTSKLGLTLNLKTPEGIEIAKRLIGWADVYIESFTPGTVAGLGIGYDTVRALNPSIIMVSTCLMGQTGPAAAFSGYGFHAGAIAGFYEVTGWPDLPPDGPWIAYTDAIAPRILASTVMAALDHRRRTGQGQFIDAGQMEMSLQFLAPEIIDFKSSGRLATRKGNRSDTAAPHGVYPCAGEDQWCAIAVQNDDQWTGLRQAIGDPDWARDPRFDTAAGRLDHQDEIDRRISSWTSDCAPQEVMRLLQAQAVPAGVVQRSSDLMKDPQLIHRRLFRELEHPEVGRAPYTGHLFNIRGYDSGPRFAPPVMGQHNEQVLKEVLGMSDDEIGEAVIAGALE